MLVERSIDAEETVATLERLVAERGAPEHLSMDNGSELTAHALQDWCRFSKTGTAYIDPGSPWQNPYVESFHSRVRDELLDVEEFSCLAEAKVVISDWREDYNQRRPHSALACVRPPRSPPSGTPPRSLPPPDLAQARCGTQHEGVPRRARRDHRRFAFAATPLDSRRRSRTPPATGSPRFRPAQHLPSR